MVKVFLLTIILLLPGWGSPAWGTIAENRAQLDRIKVRIAEAEKTLRDKKSSELAINRDLAVLNKTLQRIDVTLTELKQNQQQVRADIVRQQGLVDATRHNNRKITARLEKRLVALYKEGEIGPLKVLFSADSPTSMVQQYHYLTRVLDHDRELLQEYRARYDVQRRQLDDLHRLEAKKEQLIDREQAEKQTALEGRRLQQRLLARARRDKSRINAELVQLQQNAKRLKELIERLQAQTVTPPGAVANHFAVGRGKLRWPVEGRVMIGFGTQKDAKLGTYYESNGIEIAVSPGTPIKAVAAGKIVFADYFKGYGNLYILSHPGGYHTLYAQTDRMQKKLGAQVAAGDLLGYSGQGGRDSIYFEIRSKGAPVNPMSWLIKR